MRLRCVPFLLSLLLCVADRCRCEHVLNNFNEEANSANEPRSRLRDVQFAENDTCLAINFENLNDQQLPFYLHTEQNYKFNMAQFTEDFVEVKFINLVNNSEHVNSTISLKKTQEPNGNATEEEEELVHYELFMNSTKYYSNFCWNLTYEHGVHWYGAPANLKQHWPIDPSLQIRDQPYITSGFFKNSTGSLVEYVWFSSSGYLVFVERDVPLFISLENGILCLSAKNNMHPYNAQPAKKSQQNDRSPFKAHIIVSRNIKDAYLYYLDNFVERPQRSPNPAIYSSNIWSTWVKFKMQINQQNLLEFAKNISSSGFTKYGSIFEIDDKWESSYGNWKFDKARFPNAKQMIAEIKKLGFNTSVWLTPFFSPEENQLDAEERDFMVKDLNSRQSKKLDWWNGRNATVLDPTSPRARRWFIKRVRKLLNEYSLDTFKADAGEISWMKTPFKLSLREADLAPNKFSEYISFMISQFENVSSIELRTGFNSQRFGNLVRVLDKDSNWSYENGFKSLIPSCLTYSIFGYPFILPDMIGGNSYGTERPDRELYLRWLAANSLLPVMQYSIAPFDFDEEVVRIALKFQELHNQFAPLFVELAENAKQTGHPIIRPMWWIAPTDNRTYPIDSQFLIGDDVIVAPIVEPNQSTRSIYLPEGQWSDRLRNVNLTGPAQLDGYPIKLDEIAHFTRL